RQSAPVIAPRFPRFALPLAFATFAHLATAAPRPPAPAPPPPTVEHAASRPTAAPAEENPGERAVSLRSQGNEAMLGMRYSDALPSYEQAAALAPDDVGLDYSIARAHQMLGDYPEALTALERFQARASLDAKARVGKLDELFGQIRP